MPCNFISLYPFIQLNRYIFVFDGGESIISFNFFELYINIKMISCLDSLLVLGIQVNSKLLKSHYFSGFI